MDATNYYFPKNKKRYIHRFCKLLATASYVPEKVVTNDEIITNHGLPFKNEVIVKATGVEKRHVAEECQDDSDLLSIAAHRCLEEYGIKPEQLTRVIVNKYMGDNLLPMTASRVQGKMGSSVANHAFDIDGGTSSFLVAMDVASRFIGTGNDYVLIASGGIHNRLISKTDPRVAFLFGDASTAILFGVAEEQHILASYFYSNYHYYHLATARGTEFLRTTRFDDDSAKFYDTYKMENWKVAEDFYRAVTLEISKNLQEESGLSMKEIDLVLVTENNAPIRELTLKALSVSEDRSLSLLKDHGNTMSATLPLLLDNGLRSGRIQKGMNIMLISHGEGISGGGMIYKV